MSVHLHDHAEWTDQLEPASRELLERSWPDATKVFSARGLDNYVKGAAALRGLGLCQLPDYYVLEHLRSGALVSLLDNQQPPDTAVWALYPQQRHLSPKVRQLVEFLKQGLAQRSEYR